MDQRPKDPSPHFGAVKRTTDFSMEYFFGSASPRDVTLEEEGEDISKTAGFIRNELSRADQRWAPIQVIHRQTEPYDRIARVSPNR
jgi:hypothetical protein